MTEWQPIDTAPRDSRVILVYGMPQDAAIGHVSQQFAKRTVCAAMWSYADDRYILFGGFMTIGPFIRPTHWMPLPEQPKAS